MKKSYFIHLGVAFILCFLASFFHEYFAVGLGIGAVFAWDGRKIYLERTKE